MLLVSMANPTAPEGFAPRFRCLPALARVPLSGLTPVLILSLVLPSPTFAMRAQGVDDPKGSARVGLEEALQEEKPVQVAQALGIRTLPSSPLSHPPPTAKSWDRQSALPPLSDVIQHVVQTSSGSPFAILLEDIQTTPESFPGPLLQLWRVLFWNPREVSEEIRDSKRSEFQRHLAALLDEDQRRFLQRLHESVEWLYQRIGNDILLRRAIGSVFVRPDNDQIRFVLLEPGFLGNQMARYFEITKFGEKPVIAIDETFYRHTIGGETVTPGGRRVFLERLLHELVHDNQIGTYEEEVAEERRVLREIDWLLYEVLGEDRDLEEFLASLPPDIKPLITGKGKYKYFASIKRQQSRSRLTLALQEANESLQGTLGGQIRVEMPSTAPQRDVGEWEHFLRGRLEAYARGVVSSDLRRFGKAFAMLTEEKEVPSPEGTGSTSTRTAGLEEDIAQETRKALADSRSRNLLDTSERADLARLLTVIDAGERPNDELTRKVEMILDELKQRIKQSQGSEAIVNRLKELGADPGNAVERIPSVQKLGSYQDTMLARARNISHLDVMAMIAHVEGLTVEDLREFDTLYDLLEIREGGVYTGDPDNAVYHPEVRYVPDLKELAQALGTIRDIASLRGFMKRMTSYRQPPEWIETDDSEEKVPDYEHREQIISDLISIINELTGLEEGPEFATRVAQELREAGVSSADFFWELQGVDKGVHTIKLREILSQHGIPSVASNDPIDQSVLPLIVDALAELEQGLVPAPDEPKAAAGLEEGAGIPEALGLPKGITADGLQARISAELGGKIRSIESIPFVGQMRQTRELVLIFYHSPWRGAVRAIHPRHTVYVVRATGQETYTYQTIHVAAESWDQPTREEIRSALSSKDIELRQEVRIHWSIDPTILAGFLSTIQQGDQLVVENAGILEESQLGRIADLVTPELRPVAGSPGRFIKPSAGLEEQYVPKGPVVLKRDYSEMPAEGEFDSWTHDPVSLGDVFLMTFVFGSPEETRYELFKVDSWRPERSSAKLKDGNEAGLPYREVYETDGVWHVVPWPYHTLARGQPDPGYRGEVIRNSRTSDEHNVYIAWPTARLKSVVVQAVNPLTVRSAAGMEEDIEVTAQPVSRPPPRHQEDLYARHQVYRLTAQALDIYFRFQCLQFLEYLASDDPIDLAIWYRGNTQVSFVYRGQPVTLQAGDNTRDAVTLFEWIAQGRLDLNEVLENLTRMWKPFLPSKEFEQLQQIAATARTRRFLHVPPAGLEETFESSKAGEVEPEVAKRALEDAMQKVTDRLQEDPRIAPADIRSFWGWWQEGWFARAYGDVAEARYRQFLERVAANDRTYGTVVQAARDALIALDVAPVLAFRQAEIQAFLRGDMTAEDRRAYVQALSTDRPLRLATIIERARAAAAGAAYPQPDDEKVKELAFGRDAGVTQMRRLNMISPGSTHITGIEAKWDYQWPQKRKRLYEVGQRAFRRERASGILEELVLENEWRLEQNWRRLADVVNRHPEYQQQTSYAPEPTSKSYQAPFASASPNTTPAWAWPPLPYVTNPKYTEYLQNTLAWPLHMLQLASAAGLEEVEKGKSIGGGTKILRLVEKITEQVAALSSDDAVPTQTAQELKALLAQLQLRWSSYTPSLSGATNTPTTISTIPTTITETLSVLESWINASLKSPAERETTERLRDQVDIASLLPRVKNLLSAITSIITQDSQTVASPAVGLEEKVQRFDSAAKFETYLEQRQVKLSEEYSRLLMRLKGHKVQVIDIPSLEPPRDKPPENYPPILRLYARSQGWIEVLEREIDQPLTEEGIAIFRTGGEKSDLFGAILYGEDPIVYPAVAMRTKSEEPMEGLPNFIFGSIKEVHQSGLNAPLLYSIGMNPELRDAQIQALKGIVFYDDKDDQSRLAIFVPAAGLEEESVLGHLTPERAMLMLTTFLMWDGLWSHKKTPQERLDFVLDDVYVREATQFQKALLEVKRLAVSESLESLAGLLNGVMDKYALNPIERPILRRIVEGRAAQESSALDVSNLEGQVQDERDQFRRLIEGINLDELPPAVGLEEETATAEAVDAKRGLEKLNQFVTYEAVRDVIQLLHVDEDLDGSRITDLAEYFEGLPVMVQEAGYPEGLAQLIPTNFIRESAPLQNSITVFVQVDNPDWERRVAKNLEGVVSFVDSIEDASLVIVDRPVEVSPRQAILQVNEATYPHVTSALLQHLEKEGLLKAGSVVLLHSLVKGDLGEGLLLFA